MKKKLEAIVTAVVLIVAQLVGIWNGTAVIEAKDKRPRILLDSYEITEGQLTPGGTVKIKFNFKNTSTTIAANNLLITYSESDNMIQPEDGESNQFYIEEIEPSSYESVEIQMRVSDNIVMKQDSQEGAQRIEKSIASKVEFNISYLYDREESSYEASNDTYIILPITQECVLDVKNLTMADTGVVGSKSFVSVVCVNEGTTPISDVVMHIEGNIEEEQKEVKIGNIPVGAQQALDYYVTMQQEGNQKLEIYFTYEDEKGVKYKSVKKEYNISVSGSQTIMPTANGDNVQEQSETTGSDTFQLSLSNICILGAAVIALILIIIFIIKRKRR